MSIIQLLRRQRSGRSPFEANLGKWFRRHYLENTQHEKELVVHAIIPSYSGGRDQDDRNLKPAQANFRKTLSKKKPSQK
jgi:hypothetical protein